MTIKIQASKIRVSTTEHDEAVLFSEWLDWNRILYLHVANEGKRSFAAAARLKREGLKRGAPDYLIFTRGSSIVGYRGLAIELKRRKSHGTSAGRPSPEQLAFLHELEKCGWCAAVCWGADDAIETCIRYGLGRPNTAAKA